MSVQKIFARAAINQIVKSANTASACPKWVDMANYDGIAIVAAAAALTGTGLSQFNIVASDSPTGATNVTLIKQHALANGCAHVGDQVCLELIAEELRAAGTAVGANLRYVSAQVTQNNAGDVVVLTYIQTPARFPQLNLTTDYTS
jgi:hypothetical protein